MPDDLPPQSSETGTSSALAPDASPEAPDTPRSAPATPPEAAAGRAGRKRPPRPRSSRLRSSHCKECKADVPNPRHVLGIGEMCPECAPQYQVIGQLVEAIDGQVCRGREDLFRAMVRAVQQLNFEYAVTGEGEARKLQLGRARYRPAQMLQVYQQNRYQYEAIMRQYLNPESAARRDEARHLPDPGAPASGETAPDPVNPEAAVKRPGAKRR